jgi:DNA-binding MarR family transcriptional regulator
MEQKNYDCLKLKNQLCFPLYAASREILRKYTPLLKKIGLTYTQYIVLLVLWEVREATVSDICNQLYLDSGTLSPLLKAMEEKGLISRVRNTEDERVVTIMLTEKGQALREQALAVPEAMSCCMKLSQEEAQTLYSLLYKILK